MSIVDGTSNRNLGSLRLRYLVVAAVVTFVLMVGAVVTHWHTLQVSEENTTALTLRVNANKALSLVRSALWQADTSLNVLLISPSPEHEKMIMANIDLAEQEVKNFLSQLSNKNPKLLKAVQSLSDNLITYRQKVSFLLNKRKDNNWVYPIIPFINEEMLVSNNEFENAANIVLHLIAEDDGRSYASRRFGRFDELRDLWRYKILNFRMLLIRFAGLGHTASSPQEINIEDAHDVIEDKLSVLNGMMKKGELDFDSELALETMRKASIKWYENWARIKEFRAKKVWRNDTNFMETDVHPIQNKLFINLSMLDKELLSMSGDNVELLQETTDIVTQELWGFFALSLAFLIGIYIMIDRSLLRPISRISHALFAEGEQTDYKIADQDSKEIHQLVSAFTTMRKQIRQRQEELQVQALHDALTGLPNRVLFTDRMEQAMKDMRRTQQKMAVMILDLDRFKDINDVLGHPVGDQLLQHVAQRLEDIIRESDTVARLGGDEFAIVAPFTDVDSAAQFSAKIVNAINDVFRIEEQNLYVGVSVGIAVYPEHGRDASTLIRHADVAMYVAKRERQGFSVYKESHDEGNADDLILVESLYNELEQTEFLNLNYQPQINLFNQELVGVEALLRWNHPDLGVISPERIVEIAEYSNQIDKLTDWVIRTAFKECSQNMDTQKLIFSINLSAKNLQDDELPSRVGDLLEKYNMSPSSLTLEITESAVMSHPIKSREIMNKLSAMNIKMSVDDYGTGFSSLGYLKMLPVDELKIDKTFVFNMLEDENDAIIVRSTIELAHNLGLQVVAEGVEDNDTMMALRNLKCDVAQGYFISRPMSKQAFCAWLETYNRKVVSI